MANTKISSLTAVSGNGAATNEFIIADGTAVSKKTTLQKIVDFILTRANTFSAIQTMSAQFRQAKGADIASAATVDISAATGNDVTITGTTGITAFGTVPAGTVVTLTFATSLTITHNATSLICPNNQDIVTQAGDQVAVMSLGSGNWRVLIYKPQLVSSFSAYQSTLQSLAAATFTRALFQTEEHDNLLEYDASTSRITVKQPGIYLFSTQIYFAVSADGERHIIAFYKNGVELKRVYDSANAAAAGDSIGGSLIVRLAAGDIIDVFIFSANARDTVIGAANTYFSGVRLG